MKTLLQIIGEIKMMGKITPEMVFNIANEIYKKEDTHDFGLINTFHKYDLFFNIYSSIMIPRLEKINYSQLKLLYNDLLQLKQKYNIT